MMNFSAKVLKLVIASSFIALAACQKHEGELLEADDGLGKEYVKASCEYTADDGESALPLSPEEKVLPVSFGKKIDLSRVIAIGKTSARTTYHFIKRDGADVFAIPSVMSGACTMYDFIPEASSGLTSIWDRYNPSKGIVMGMFLPLNRVSGVGQKNPVVLVRKDTDRYTLVHEYMHFLFNREREKQGLTDAMIMEKLASTISRLKLAVTDFETALKKADRKVENVDPALVKEYILSANDFISSFKGLLTSFSLEEMSIEAILQEAVKKGIVTQVTDLDRKNSGLYILSSWKKAQEIIKSARQSIDSVKKDVLGAQGITEQLALLDSQAKYFDAIESEGQNLVNRYASTINKLSTGVTGMAHDHAHGCGRDIDVDQILKTIPSVHDSSL